MPSEQRPLRDLLGRAVDVLAVLALTALAAALRLPWFRSGWTADEIGNLAPGGWRAVLTDTENGVNPPLWRLIASLAGDGGEAIQLGRAVAIAAGVLAVPVGYALGRKAGGRLAGAAVAAGLALLPVLVDVGTLHRAYAAWVLMALLHQLGLVLGLEGRRAGWVLAAVSGAFLVQLHYLAVPLLGLLGLLVAVRTRSWRVLVGVYLPAVLVLLPWVDVILAGSPRRLASPDSPEATVLRLSALGLQAPPDLVKAVNGWLRAAGLAPPTAQRWTGGLVLLVIAAHLPWLRRLAPARQVAWVGAVGVLVASWIAAHGQYVRPHAASQLAAFLLPLLASVGAGASRRWVGLVGTTAMVLLLGLRLPQALGTTLGLMVEREALPHFAANMKTWADGAPIFVHNRYAAGWLWTQITGRPVAVYDHLGVCGNRRDCYAVGELQWSGVDVAPQGACLLVSFDRHVPEGMGEGCERLVEEGGYRVWRCR